MINKDMTQSYKTKEYSIDASGKPVGRLATEIAVVLNGKNSVNFVRNVTPEVKVKVINANKVKITGNHKIDQSLHKRYSGYPGGLTLTTWRDISEKKGFGEIIKHAVSGMLPKNKLRDLKMKNLSVEE